MEAALHPQAFGQVLTRIWQLMRPNLRLFIAIGALPAGVTVVIYALTLVLVFLAMRIVHPFLGAADIAMIVFACVTGAVGIAAILLTMALYEPAASYAALELDADRKVTFREAYAVAWRRRGRYLWLLLLRQLIAGAPALVLIPPLFLFSLGAKVRGGNGVPALAIIGVLLLVILYIGAMVWAILVMIRLVLAYPACITENLTAWEAVRRSNRLSQGGRLRIFLVGLVLYAVTYAAVLACELVFGIVIGLGIIPIAIFHLGLAWMITGAVLVGICLVCALLLLGMCISSSYSVAFAILYRQHVRLESTPLGASGAAI
jgi:hypothetical protein